MKKILLSTAIIGTLFISGCSTTNDPVKEQAKQAEGYVDMELQGAPKWVMMPFVEGNIAEVGSAPRNAGNDVAFQRDEAMANARDNLAKQINTKVSNMFKSFKAATGSGKDSTFDKSSESISKQIASETLRGSVQKDVWYSKSGTMYVLVAIDTKSITAQMEESVKTSFGNDQALYQKFLASKAQGELDAELQKVK